MRVLRHYQNDAVTGIFRAWDEHVSTLLTMATGCGKTEVFSEVIRQRYTDTRKRTIVLVHRNELVWQAVRRIQGLGLECAVEMADLQADSGLWDRAPVVVSTIQTQIAGNGGHGRMRVFTPDDFSTVIVDEAHHATSKSWRKTIDWYMQNEALKLCGVTATPDRADKEALGQVFQSVAFDYVPGYPNGYDILTAINDGYLVPIDQRYVEIEGLDFSGIKTTAGDLNGGELAAVLESEKNLHGMTSAMIEIIGDKRAVVFTRSVKQAEMSAEIFNRHKSGMAGWVFDKTPKHERRAMLQQFDDGELQSIFNVGILTEGWDSPGVEVVADDSPTKSRSLYAQKIGRGTRPLAGLVDGPGMETAEARRAAIAASSKPSLLVIDFAGNSGRHKLITVADILGGNVSEAALELAKVKAKEAGKSVRVDELLAESERDIKAEIEERKRKEAARRAHIKAQAEFKTKSVDPFDMCDVRPKKASSWDDGQSLTSNQRAVLLRNGINVTGMPYGQQKQLLTAIFKRKQNNLASLNQVRALRKRGVNTDGLTFQQASAKLDEISKKEGWKPKPTNGNGASTSNARPEPIRPAPPPGSPVDEPPWMKDLFG